MFFQKSINIFKFNIPLPLRPRFPGIPGIPGCPVGPGGPVHLGWRRNKW